MNVEKKDIVWFILAMVGAILLGDWVWVIVGFLVGALMGMYAGVNMVTWAVTRDELGVKERLPFNWRVALGPRTYFRWINRRGGYNEEGFNE